MPELPPQRRQVQLTPAAKPDDAECDSDRPAYAELHCHTNYSFLRGASHPDELVEQAANLGLTAIAVTDRNTLAGVVRAHVAANEVGLKLLVGAEIVTSDGPPVVLVAMNRTGYGNLSQLITLGRRRAPKGECHLQLHDVLNNTDGLIACVVTQQHLFAADQPDDVSRMQQHCTEIRDAFAGHTWLLAERLFEADDARQFQRLSELSTQTSIPIAAANDVHYHVTNRRPLQDVLTAIRHKSTVAAAAPHLFQNAERHLKPPATMNQLFADSTDAVAETVRIANLCNFSLSELKYEYPEELSPSSVSAIDYLRQLAAEGAAKRYPDGVSEKVQGLINYELQLIEDLNYESYFLTVNDLVQFARSRGILCQGRGSAANSVVCFCLGVTSVDPQRIDVLFERFISRERNEAPDIDVDFEHERREEVLQYIYNRYGRDRAGMTGVVITYRPKSAVRDVSKALGFSPDRIDALAESISHYSDEDMLAQRFQEVGLDMKSDLARQLMYLLKQIIGFPRHLSQHVGGMVITRDSLSALVPIENAAMDNRTVIEWDKNDLDALGILKVDCLSLGMLSAIHKCFDMVELHHDRPLTLATVPAEDPAVYDMISKAETMGVFQIESRAQMSMLPRLRPACFYDLVIEVAIVRPGPIQGDMVHPYLRRRSGEEAVEYPNDEVRAVLHKTLGVPIFQEQAMRLAVVAAGFTPGEADQLRRAMGAWRRPGVIDQFRLKLIKGMKDRGYDDDFADRLFNQIRGFGEYGFPESHAASFALLVYVSSWLKHYYPAAFHSSIINSQPMGFYAPAQLIGDAKRNGVQVRPIDVNHSDWDLTLEPTDSESNSTSTTAIRLGLRLISGFKQSDAELIMQRRTSRRFDSLDDFARRTGFSNSILSRLAKADVFNSVGMNRRKALWQSLPSQQTLPMFDEEPLAIPPESLPTMTPQEEVVSDYQTAGVSLRQHPVSFIRSELQQLRAQPTAAMAECPKNRRMTVAGLVLMRQRPSTASGITFVTLEDESGFANLIVKPDVWERFRRAARTARIMMASGIVQREGDIIHLLTDRIEDVSDLLQQVTSRSRDFR
ncbi:error-prone DNA polymerase [bacterium]|nr:error-prone DNA polymerase [bacterium]